MRSSSIAARRIKNPARGSVLSATAGERGLNGAAGGGILAAGATGGGSLVVAPKPGETGGGVDGATGIPLAGGDSNEPAGGAGAKGVGGGLDLGGCGGGGVLTHGGGENS